MPTSLRSLAQVIRSKNAGPFELTLDIVFNGREEYTKAKESGVITVQSVAALYQIPQDDILHFIWYEPANAFKVTMVRPVDSGSIGERDTYGAQQHAPLLSLEFPF